MNKSHVLYAACLSKSIIFLAILLLTLLVTTTSTIFAYQPTGVKWPQPSTTFYVDIQGEDGLWNDAFEGAMYEWGAATVFNYYIVRGVYSDPCNLWDERNGVRFSSTHCGDAWGSTTLAICTWWYIGSTIVETDIVFNSNDSWNVYDTAWSSGQWYGINDFRRVAVHELGHAIGLGHEDSGVPSIMRSYVGNITIPQQDDIDGVNALYSAPCNYSISPSSCNFTSNGGTKTVSVTASSSSCSWTTSESLSWVSLSPISGTGSRSVTVSVTENTGPARSGSISIAEKTYTVSQEKTHRQTAVILTSASPDHVVTSNSDEKVYGTSASNYITLESGANAELINFSGQNNIQIESNSDFFTISRQGTVVIFTGSEGTVLKIPATKDIQTIIFNGEGSRALQIHSNQVMLKDQVITTTPVSIEDVPAPCTFILSSTNGNFSSSGGNKFVSITASDSTCQWTVSESLPWVTVSPISGIGDDTLTIIVEANTETVLRDGTVTIAGNSYAITQQALDCTFDLSSTSGDFDAFGESKTVSIDASDPMCGWSVSEDLSWTRPRLNVHHRMKARKKTNGVEQNDLKQETSLNG